DAAHGSLNRKGGAGGSETLLQKEKIVLVLIITASCPSLVRSVFQRQEVRHGEVALARVVIEAENAAACRGFLQFLGDGGEGSTRGDADEHAFLPCGAAGHFAGVFRFHLNDAVEQA